MRSLNYPLLFFLGISGRSVSYRCTGCALHTTSVSHVIVYENDASWIVEGTTCAITWPCFWGLYHLPCGQLTWPDVNFRARAGLLRFRQLHLLRPARALSLTCRSIVQSSSPLLPKHKAYGSAKKFWLARTKEYSFLPDPTTC